MPHDTLTLHPLANTFPEMTAEELNDLIADIHAHGQRVPILTHKGQVVDGKHRLAACRALQIEPLTEEWKGEGSLTDHVVSLNMHRRHLTASQRAAVALSLEPDYAAEAKENMRANPGGKPGGGKVATPIKARQQAAKAVGAGARYVQDLKRVQKKAPLLIEMVKTGKLTVPAAVARAEGGNKNTPTVSVETLWSRITARAASIIDDLDELQSRKQEVAAPLRHAQALAGALRKSQQREAA